MPLVLNGTTGVQDNSGAFVRGTAVASTSGTSIDFTGIPSWVKRVTVMLNGVSLSGAASFLVQIGNNTPTTSGYSSLTTYNTGAGGGIITSTAGVPIQVGSASYAIYGSLTINNISGNTWTASGVLGNNNNTAFSIESSGLVTLSSTLNMVRITSTNGTDTFDAGSINILYE